VERAIQVDNAKKAEAKKENQRVQKEQIKELNLTLLEEKTHHVKYLEVATS